VRRRARKTKTPERRRGGESIPRATREFLHPRETLARRRVEVKHFDVDTPAAPIATGGTITKLTTIAQGVAGNQRVGDEAQFTGVSFKGYVRGLAAGGDSVVRVMLFQWNVDDASLPPTVVTVLQAAGSSRPYNWQSIQDGNIRVLYYHTLDCCPTSGQAVQHFEYIQAVTGQLAYNTGLATGSGQLYVLTICDNNIGAANLIQWDTRVIYEDS